MIRNVYRKVQTDLINKKQNLPGDREGLSVVGAEVVGLSVGDLVGFSYVEKKNCWGKITFHIFKGNNKSKLTVGSRVGWSVLIVGSSVLIVGETVGFFVGFFVGSGVIGASVIGAAVVGEGCCVVSQKREGDENSLG